MSRIWEDVTSLLKTATAACDGGRSEIAILLDEGNGMRIVDASGWSIDALRREYQASSAYTVKRSSDCVVIEGRNDSDHCTVRKTVSSSGLTNLRGSIPYHLVCPERMLPA